MAWLLEAEAEGCITKADHGRECKASLSGPDGFEARAYARELAKTLSGMEAVFEVERPKRDDEESEPEKVPC